VALLIVPVSDVSSGGVGVLTVRRGIDPQKGKLALPGGFIETGETWKSAAVRELQEETGLHYPASSVTSFDIKDGRSTVLLFGLLSDEVRSSEIVEQFTPNREVTGLEIITEPRELAFPSHTEVIKQFFD